MKKYLYRNSFQLELQAILNSFTDIFWEFEWQLGDKFLEEKVFLLRNNFVEDTHRENAPTTQGFTKTMTWTKWRFAYLVTTLLVVIGPFWTSHSICYNRAVLYRNVTLCIVVLSTKKRCSNLWRFSFLRRLASKLKSWKHWKCPVIDISLRYISLFMPISLRESYFI